VDADFAVRETNMTEHTVSNAGLAFIQEAEGFRSAPGQMPNGAWVVGHGHARVEPGEPVDESEAANLLREDIAPFQHLVNEKVTQSLTQSQFDALVSFAFSVGADAFTQSQVLRRANSGDFIAAACAMDAWRKSDVSGELEVVDALVRRRSAEKAMFLKDIAHEAAPSAFLRAKLDHAASILGAPIKFAPAPAVGSIPVAAPKAEVVAQLADILKSEPATEPLLLTQVVSDDLTDDEIITAHTKPVARRIDIVAALPVDRRIRSEKNKAEGKALNLDALRRVALQHSFESFGLAALMLFGLILVGVGASMLLEGTADGIAVLAASALCAPGIAAVLLATCGFLRAPRVTVRAD
jgi:GH24 family phage-related lysozyme (muramidase)